MKYIGRWMNVDPLAEDFPGWTPYHYVHNNPMNLIDPTGMSARPVFEVEGKASIGLQAGLSVPFGSIEAGAITADIGSLGYSNQNPDQPIARWGDGTGHNFIGGSLNVPYFKNIAISGKLDYVTKDMTPSGQLLDYYPNHGV